MYVCGPTVYDLPHIGHGRYNLVFDILRRYLLFGGQAVQYVSNITDVDDNIIKRANEQGRSEPEVAHEFEERWWEAMDGLDVLRPDDTPHATAYISDMVALVADLLARRVAYETSDGVYLDVSQVDGYGLLARQSLDSLRAGARVEENEEKRSPLDFAVWKKAKEGEPSWKAPWGPGRPGWHTECVVMSLDLLGDGFDLHGGGRDLAFPHHENERAQAVAEGTAVRPSLGAQRLGRGRGDQDVQIPRQLHLADGPAEPCRRPRLSPAGPAGALPLADRGDARHHRRRREGAGTPRRFGPALRASRTCSSAATVALSSPARGDAADIDEGALAVVPRSHGRRHGHAGRIGRHLRIGELRANSAADAGDEGVAARLAHTASVLLAALGVSLRDESGEVDEASAALVTARDEARRTKDFARADALRDELVALGWTVEDTPSGTAIRR